MQAELGGRDISLVALESFDAVPVAFHCPDGNAAVCRAAQQVGWSLWAAQGCVEGDSCHSALPRIHQEPQILAGLRMMT